jgi:hypothetical protein
MNRHEQPDPDELHAVEARIRAARVHADAFELDQIKQRVIARRGAQPRRAAFMTSRIATFASVVVLGVGTTGAIAVASGGSPSGPTGGAASGQYWPGKGCGDRNHDHQPTGKPCPPQAGGDNGNGGDHGNGGNGDNGNGHGHSGHGD